MFIFNWYAVSATFDLKASAVTGTRINLVFYQETWANMGLKAALSYGDAGLATRQSPQVSSGCLGVRQAHNDDSASTILTSESTLMNGLRHHGTTNLTPF